MEVVLLKVVLVLLEKYLSLIHYRICRKNISICLYHYPSYQSIYQYQ